MYWPRLDELDEARVDAAYEIIAQMVEEKHPELNPRRGVLGDLVTELHAVMQGVSMEAIERLRRSFSPAELALEPELAEPVAIDMLAANYGVYRQITTKATGYITVILDRASGINFGPSSQFRARGQLFYVKEIVSVCPPNSGKPTSHSVPATALEDGLFAVQVPVIAAGVHEDAMLKRRDQLVPAIRPPGFKAAYATDDFVGGYVSQSNTELIRQMQAGAAAPGFSGSENIKALVRTVSADIVDIAVIGAYDPEMTRDRGKGTISGGGKIDIYLQSCTYPASKGLIKDATLIRQTETARVWQIEIGRDEAPGFYEVRDIQPAGTDPRQSECVVTEDTRTLDTDWTETPPTIRLFDEGKYSRYQHAVITFEETCDPGEFVPGAVATFDVTVLYMPLVAEVQDHLDSPEVQQPGLDVLVKAVKPAWFRVDIFCTDAVDAEACKLAAARYVNSLPLGQQPKPFLIAGALPDSNAVINVVITEGTVTDRATKAFLSPDHVHIG